MTRRIYLVDDHDVVRAGMKAVLDDTFDIVGEAGDIDAAVAGILETKPEMVVLDVKLPSGGGADVIERVRRSLPEVKFMALTVSSSRDDVVKMMQAGVDGYVTKTTLADQLPDLIDRTLDGQRPVTADVAAFMLDIDEDIDATSTIERLTPREREVVNLIARGYSYRETAARLSISVKTLESHMGNIFEKLSVASRHELAALAYEEGYVDRPDP
ncbi:MAG TPA: response regulator transcription factor [Acidimicrobiia bacterium]|nr:response regulator transcription factor [Acidimicrobiia bacterium]